jgi:DNA-3-methyladenine glycosylase I
MICLRGKIKAVIQNARRFRKNCGEFISFSAYIRRFSGERPSLYHGHEKGIIPVGNGLAHQMRRDLKIRGFEYLGSITVYSHLKASGIINDHGENRSCYVWIDTFSSTVQKRRSFEKGA